MKPLSKKVFLKITPPGIGDIIGDKERLLKSLEKEFGKVEISQRILKAIYPLCREANWEITLTLVAHEGQWEIVRLEPGDTTKSHYGLAVDLGSTTVTMELVDLNSGEILAEESIFNHQIDFGDDILSRIFYTKSKPLHLKEVQESTLQSFRELMLMLSERTGVASETCGIMVVSGNTTMIHFLLGIDPWPIFEAPFTPVFNHTGFFDAQEISLPIEGLIYCVPSVANYFGGDILSGLLVSDLHKKEELGLFIDIGTNGEMVLGNKNFLLAGAGAAGPALEGGISKNGMKATDGAVDSVVIEDNILKLTTIGGSRPRGICGSGIVDILAQMLLNGWIDFSGHFNTGVTDRVIKKDGEYAVAYAWEDESATGEVLLFTQTDISQFMDTKAAANTMVAYLLDSLGVEATEVKRLYTAGAFGTYINLESAITIGLYPDLPRERFVSLGNGSLRGSYALLINGELLKEIMALQREVRYLEFGAATDFLTQMFAARFLPHTNFDLYPTVKAELIKRGRLRL
ncbi:ASKHA domain-containing protein [Acetobacterium bakii]|nr:ASKHA domain-containing protein [Acetobacterium bakii]